ncbi:hypothetical protein HZD82_24785, partial [Pantoea agglomerans]|nr:hypothetical protein [Pantoea agglomerans]
MSPCVSRLISIVASSFIFSAAWFCLWSIRKGLSILGWTPDAEQLRLRIQCAARWLPEESWPATDDETLL